MLARRDYFGFVRRWLWLVLLAALVGGAAAYVSSEQMKPTYEATTTLLVNVTASPNSLTYNDVLLSQQLSKTYSEMAVQPVVLNQVIRDAKLPLGLTDLENAVTATAKLNTELITITASAHRPADAQNIANLVAQTFIAQQRQRLATGEAGNAISVVQPALLPTTPVSPKMSLNTALGAAVGALLAAGVILLVNYLDDTLKSQRDLEELFQLPVLGTVKRDTEEAKLRIDKQRIAQHQQSAEVFRMLRANLDFATINSHARVLLVTSSQKGEGKSTTASKLAVSLAEAGRRVILLDADLRLPSLQRVFGLPNQEGLTNLLVRPFTDLERYLQATPMPALRVLTSGPLPPNPTELLQSERMAALIRALSERADMVIIDTPPVLAVADALTLSPKVQGIILVAESGKVRLSRLQEAVNLLRRSPTPIVGAVLNKVSRDAEAYNYRYDYSYGGYYPNSKDALVEHQEAVAPSLNGTVATDDLLEQGAGKH